MLYFVRLFFCVRASAFKLYFYFVFLMIRWFDVFFIFVFGCDPYFTLFHCSRFLSLVTYRCRHGFQGSGELAAAFMVAAGDQNGRRTAPKGDGKMSLGSESLVIRPSCGSFPLPPSVISRPPSGGEITRLLSRSLSQPRHRLLRRGPKTIRGQNCHYASPSNLAPPLPLTPPLRLELPTLMFADGTLWHTTPTRVSVCTTARTHSVFLYARCECAYLRISFDLNQKEENRFSGSALLAESVCEMRFFRQSRPSRR